MQKSPPSGRNRPNEGHLKECRLLLAHRALLLKDSVNILG